jgi:hypothetical protein
MHISDNQTDASIAGATIGANLAGHQSDNALLGSMFSSIMMAL